MFAEITLLSELTSNAPLNDKSAKSDFIEIFFTDPSLPIITSKGVAGISNPANSDYSY